MRAFLHIQAGRTDLGREFIVFRVIDDTATPLVQIFMLRSTWENWSEADGCPPIPCELEVPAKAVPVTPKVGMN